MSSSSFKIVLLGEGRVGKTCLFIRYIKNEYNDNQDSTTQANYLEKRLNIGKSPVKLMIWDTAGQERFHALGPIYYRDANGALLVYDITDRDSFTKVRNWVKELRKIVGPDIVLVIAGNKIDLEKQRQVDDTEANEYAQSVNAIHIHCSAKLGKGVDAAFLELTKGMLKLSQENANTKNAPGMEDRPSSRKLVSITNNDDRPKDDKCC